MSSTVCTCSVSENSRPPALEWRGGIEASSAQFFSARQVALRGVTTARGDVWLHLPRPFVLSAHCQNKCVALG